MANSKKSSSSSKSSSKSATNKAKKQAVKYAKKHKKGVAIFVAVVVILIAAVVLITYLIKPEFIKNLFNSAVDAYKEYTSIYYNDSSDDDGDNVNGASVNFASFNDQGSLTEIQSEDNVFSIHFLELGNKYTGDSTLIKCGDTEVLIDAGSRKSSATTISSYLDKYVEGDLDYVIATHAHQDHIAGFVGTGSGNNKTGILYKYNVGTLIQFANHNSSATIYNSYVSATEYAQSKGASVYTALQCWNQTDGASKTYYLNDEHTLSLNILYNYYYENETSDENDYSVCVMLSYTPADGEAKYYLFTGDLEGDGEKYLVQYNDLPKVELFKGAHHGSKTSSTDTLLSKIQPKNVAICCCTGSTEYTTNNDNTFPTQAFIDRISKYTQNVYCTTLVTDYKNGKYESMNGNIVFYVTNSSTYTLKLWCSNNYTLLKDTAWFAQNRTTPTNWAS
jgi:beta-lactamase superfamily II metal-dependent hydrolase